MMVLLWIIIVAACLVVLYAGVPNLLARVLRIGCVWRGPRVPQVALTFDDGPDEAYTGDVLDILKHEQVSATFFVLAEKALREPALIERMVQEGHDVGLHGYTHRLVPASTPGQTRRQVKEAAQALRARFAVSTHLYRPTWGLCNLWTFIGSRKWKHRLVTWSIMVGDWRVTPADELLARIEAKLHPGAIIVLHDSDATYGAEIGAPVEVIRMLPALIQSVHAKGFEFATLSTWVGRG